MLDRGVRRQIEKRGADDLFSSVAPLFRSVDATVINLEMPITSRKTPLRKKFIFRGEPGWTATLRRAGITHAAMANNHTNDQGYKGLEDTARHLRDEGITPLGYGLTSEERVAPTLITKSGITVALFNSVTIPLEHWFQTEGRPGVCQHSPKELAKAIKGHKASHPHHHIVVILHWGQEYSPTPSLHQRHGARILTQAGADIIVGHHPHVIQSAEKIGEKYVYYSIGNFVFDQKGERESEALILRLDFTTRSVSPTTYNVKITDCRPDLR